MSTIGYGYGSEWHLLRYLGYHREVLNEAIRRQTSIEGIRWLDHAFHGAAPFLSREWQGVDFLPDRHPARHAWPDFWPQRGNVQNWDAVGQANVGGREVWLLVEAKGHVEEALGGVCAAAENGGRPQIVRALSSTRAFMKIADSGRDWLGQGYQMANRLAALYHLDKHGVTAHLVNIYFLGDRQPKGPGPKSEQDWEQPLRALDDHLGLTPQTPLMDRVHKLFLPVCPGGAVRELNRQPQWSPKPLRRPRGTPSDAAAT